ncbi:MAG: methyl-accepting chemotaxis protein [Woeseia sp.]|nr:methyl-accepting chemotaxis protein [Woeseia sp.]NNE61689.1 methyl-accepting chemotaxis protein [Woeseia sp.]NNL53832.1 methyl-accepting chemotaxis protein [Woeseia sp.]
MAEKPDKTSLFIPLALLTGVLLIAAATLFWLQNRSVDGPDLSLVGVATLSQSLALQASRVQAGETAALPRLDANLTRLRQLRSASEALPGDRGQWDALTDSAATIVEQGTVLRTVDSAAQAIAQTVPDFQVAATSLLTTAGSVSTLQALQQRAQSLSNTAAALWGSNNPQELAATISEELADLRSIHGALSGEAEGLDIAAIDRSANEASWAAFDEAFDAIATNADTLLASVSGIAEVRAAADYVVSAAQQLETPLVNASGSSADSGSYSSYVVPGLLIAALLSLIGLVFIYRKNTAFEQAALAQAEQNERNQQAILRLLDELDSLADGDLTVEATVTEDITGAIADSINYAIEKLRELVATINETAIMVDSAAKQTESTAVHMARAADNQNREIKAATESIVSMAGSIEEVSGNAERSSDVARHSVDVAHKGGDAVRRTIDGMNTIRETIQDTSKRIKRLGESSQEIGNIVELINDIAEQTNILALNASIQASMAGEAGRGFAVVADEVQRLAERSTNATKQIEVLVRTIQSDTNEAVVSMERSTTDVVGGALLAENAGAALDEIEQVSNQIASLVQNISGSAREQASSAADVTRRTSKLKEISEQTGNATIATAAAISKLSELASQLRDTVAGFTLPTSALQMRNLAGPAEEEELVELHEPGEDQAAG